MRSRLFGSFLATAFALSLAAGCARTHAKTVPEAPALDVPAAPPRAVESGETDTPPAPVSIVAEPAHRVPARPVRQPAKSEPPRPEPKPEPQKAEPAPPSEPAPAENAPKPGTVLQTTPTDAEGEVERAIRGLLARASADLSRVDYRALSPDARVQYGTAKRFVAQAEEALRARNLVFARNLADKAAGLAAQLVGR